MNDIIIFNMNIEKYINTDWKNVLLDESNKEYFKNLIMQLKNDYNKFIVFPKKENIFECFNYFNIVDLRVVLIGQDPYHNDMQATGLSFSVPKDVNIPSSLRNLFKELENDLNIKKYNGDLTNWAKQGVLLLNRVLTVIKNKPKSHENIGWKIFTTNIIKFIDSNFTDIVFILLGNDAKKMEKYIFNNKLNIVKAAHPSGLSAYKGFYGSKIFSKTNELLNKNNKKIINW